LDLASPPPIQPHYSDSASTTPESGRTNYNKETHKIMAEFEEYENVLTHKSDYGYYTQNSMGPMTYEEHYT
jgi:hypothetical protein